MAAGPWTGALLGMLGAEVIKVEPPAGDDPAPRLGEHTAVVAAEAGISAAGIASMLEKGGLSRAGRVA